jgi:biotin carboxyl carrier protein
MEKIAAPIPGKVVSIKVKAGQTVQAGDLVFVLEALKMENEIFCDEGGKVVEINANEGDNVDVGQVIVVLE